eukprot:10787736-Heterocapsa_arctica.AAC.1
MDAYGSGFNVLLWASLPCTAWCMWQHVNAKLSDEAFARVQQEREESRLMLEQLARALGEVHNAQVPLAVAFEWPRRADGWKVQAVQNILRGLD